MAGTFFTVDSISHPDGQYRQSMWQDTTRSAPSDGGWVHGVESTDDARLFETMAKNPASAGRIVLMEAAESFASGAQLATNGSGQVRAASAGDVLVATALEGSSGAGDSVWVVLETQRVL